MGGVSALGLLGLGGWRMGVTCSTQCYERRLRSDASSGLLVGVSWVDWSVCFVLDVVVEQELLAFPNSRHDDIVDVISYAAQHIQQRKKRRRKKLVGWKLDRDLYKPRLSI
jgi:hypothetical protein